MSLFMCMLPSDRRSCAIVTVSESVLSQRLEDETVILNLDTGLYYTLNTTGSDIWETLIKYGYPRVVFDRVLAAYEANADDFRKDFRGFLEEISQVGLIKL